MTPADHARLKRLNKLQYREALIAAEWCIWSDRRLLGIPAVRYPMARAAALEAIGASAPLQEKVYSDLHDDSANVVLSVYVQAVASARQAISHLAPTRFTA